MHLNHKILGGKANSVSCNPDQAESNLGLHCLHICNFIRQVGGRHFRLLTILFLFTILFFFFFSFFFFQTA